MNVATSVIYNSTATSLNGDGGTTINTPYNVFSLTNLTLQADYSMQTIGGNNADSLGFWVWCQSVGNADERPACSGTSRPTRATPR